MSGRLVGEVLANRARLQLTDAEFAILVSLAESARTEHRIAYRGTHHERLAEHAGRTPGTTRNVLSGLIRKGYLIVAKAGNRGSPAHYEIPDLAELSVIPGNDTIDTPKPVDNPVNGHAVDSLTIRNSVIPRRAESVIPGNDTYP